MIVVMRARRYGKATLLKAENGFDGMEIKPWRRRDEPTDAQLRSGRYPKRKVVFAGFPIAVETEAGHLRRGVNRDGVQWEHRLPFAYGYFEDTLGVDGDAVDVFLGLHDEAPFAFVVRQMKVNRWDQYDEDKVMLGFYDQSGAEAAFKSCYNDPRFMGSVTPVHVINLAALLQTRRGQPLTDPKVFLWKRP